METKNYFKSKKYKILLPITIIIGIISMTKAGYHLGQWIYQAVN
jgi:ABC-type enterochelin transport system permease subunit